MATSASDKASISSHQTSEWTPGLPISLSSQDVTLSYHSFTGLFAKLFPEIREISNQNIAYEHVQVFEVSPYNDKFSVHCGEICSRNEYR